MIIITNMYSIDEKDRKILEELDKDCRKTDSEIAKRVGLSKQVVNYRIKRLIESGLITDFYTVINIGKLGLNSHYIFLQLEKINKEQEEKLIEKLRSLNYIGWLVSGTGRWDIILLIYANSLSEFEELLTKTLSICKNHVHEYNFATLISAEHISYKFLSKTKGDYGAKQTEKQVFTPLENKDKKILEGISQNARISVVELSNKTKIPIYVIRYHIKNLLKEKIIGGFKPKININKLGLQWHLLLLQLQNISKERKKEFINFCKQHNKIYYVTNVIGLYNIMLDIHVKNTEEFKEVLFELKEKFSDIIRLYESVIIFEEYKINYFPNT